MIEVSQVTKRYGDLTAIDRVSFTVEKGEVLAFLGPNGAGKTTTMRILTFFRKRRRFASASSLSMVAGSLPRTRPIGSQPDCVARKK